MRAVDLVATSALLGRNSVGWISQPDEGEELPVRSIFSSVSRIDHFSGCAFQATRFHLDVPGRSDNIDRVNSRSVEYDGWGFADAILFGFSLNEHEKANESNVLDSPQRDQKADIWRPEIEKLFSNLGRLTDGWAGEDSFAPTSSVLRDLEAAMLAFDHISICPHAEVDSSDGSIALVWDLENESFSLVFNGNGTVIGVMSPARACYPAWALSAEDDSGLAEKLESDALSKFIRAK